MSRLTEVGRSLSGRSTDDNRDCLRDNLQILP